MGRESPGFYTVIYDDSRGLIQTKKELVRRPQYISALISSKLEKTLETGSDHYSLAFTVTMSSNFGKNCFEAALNNSVRSDRFKNQRRRDTNMYKISRKELDKWDELNL